MTFFKCAQTHLFLKKRPHVWNTKFSALTEQGISNFLNRVITQIDKGVAWGCHRLPKTFTAGHHAECLPALGKSFKSVSGSLMVIFPCSACRVQS